MLRNSILVNSFVIFLSTVHASAIPDILGFVQFSGMDLIFLTLFQFFSFILIYYIYIEQ